MAHRRQQWWNQHLQHVLWTPAGLRDDVEASLATCRVPLMGQRLLLQALRHDLDLILSMRRTKWPNAVLHFLQPVSAADLGPDQCGECQETSLGRCHPTLQGSQPNFNRVAAGHAAMLHQWSRWLQHWWRHWQRRRDGKGGHSQALGTNNNHDGEEAESWWDLLGKLGTGHTA